VLLAVLQAVLLTVLQAVLLAILLAILLPTLLSKSFLAFLDVAPARLTAPCIVAPVLSFTHAVLLP
jgi:hypothetical protein